MPKPAPNELPTTVLRVNHHNAKHIAERYPYAAYGSNLSLAQMVDRCKNADAIARAVLPNHRLILATFASIEYAKGVEVPIGVYKLDADDIDRLDKREGLGRSYDRFLVTVLADDGRAIRCFTYVKRDSRLVPPSNHYYAKLLEGYRDWNFDDRRLRHARRNAVKDFDANKAKYDADAAANAQTMWEDWYNGRGDQQSFSFGNVNHKTGQARARSNDDSPVSLVTGRCRKCGWKHYGDCPKTAIEAAAKETEFKVLPKELYVPKFLSVSFTNVEWGQRDGNMYWRVKNTRAWYTDVSSKEDEKIGIVRGTLATNLPGSSAFVPREGKDSDQS